MAIPGAELVAGMLKDTLGVFTSKLGSKSNAPVTVAGKCAACGHRWRAFRGRRSPVSTAARLSS